MVLLHRGSSILKKKKKKKKKKIGWKGNKNMFERRIDRLLNGGRGQLKPRNQNPELGMKTEINVWQVIFKISISLTM